MDYPGRKSVRAALFAAAFAVAAAPALCNPPGPNVRAEIPTKLVVIARDDRVALLMHPPAVVVDNGSWQPYLFWFAPSGCAPRRKGRS